MVNMQCGNIALRTNRAGCIYEIDNFPFSPQLLQLYVILGECSALWGEHEGVVWCITVFHSNTFSHLHTSHSLIPRSSHGLFPLRQFPLCQLLFGQLPLRQFPLGQFPCAWSMLTKWELTKWENLPFCILLTTVTNQGSF